MQDRMSEFERRLGAMVPATPEIGVERIAFIAGRVSARRAAWRWRLASGLLAGLLLLAVVPRPEGLAWWHSAAPSPPTLAERGESRGTLPAIRDVAQRVRGSGVERVEFYLGVPRIAHDPWAGRLLPGGRS